MTPWQIGQQKSSGGLLRKNLFRITGFVRLEVIFWMNDIYF